MWLTILPLYTLRNGYQDCQFLNLQKVQFNKKYSVSTD